MYNKPSFNEAVKLDALLFNLATYDMSKGLAYIPDSADGFIEFQKSIAQKFNYYKRLIQIGEMTFEDIQQSIVEKNGPFLQPKPKTVDDVIDDTAIIANKTAEIDKLQEEISAINVSLSKLIMRAELLSKETGESIEKILGLDKILGKGRLPLSFPPVVTSQNFDNDVIFPTEDLRIFGDIEEKDLSNMIEGLDGLIKSIEQDERNGYIGPKKQLNKTNAPKKVISKPKKIKNDTKRTIKGKGKTSKG